ncbi:hypothetical protein Q8F55_009205 [Vanrija albida]|uniref:Histidine kinase n=1 Tax=Vanrija albida TaxID=181172 RepID=A0ABR3PT03_9TREE
MGSDENAPLALLDSYPFPAAVVRLRRHDEPTLSPPETPLAAHAPRPPLVSAGAEFSLERRVQGLSISVPPAGDHSAPSTPVPALAGRGGDALHVTWSNEHWRDAGVSPFDLGRIAAWLQSGESTPLQVAARGATIQLVRCAAGDSFALLGQQFTPAPSPRPAAKITRSLPWPRMVAPFAPAAGDAPPPYLRKPSSPMSCRELFEHVDWSRTSLGPLDEWPAGAVTALELMFSHKSKIVLKLGSVTSELYSIYNDAFSPIGFRHPWMIGRQHKDLPYEIRSAMDEDCDRVLAGETIHMTDKLLMYAHDDRGRLTEEYLSWDNMPLEDNGRIFGIWGAFTSVTSRVLATRRRNTAREVTSSLATLRTSAEYFSSLTQLLESNPLDVPFMMAYSVKPTKPRGGRPRAQSADVEVELNLESTIGVPTNHASAPQKLDYVLPKHKGKSLMSRLGSTALSVDYLTSETASSSAVSMSSPDHLMSHDSESWPIQLALSTGRCVIVDDCSKLVKGFPLRAWNELPDRAIVVPLVTASTPTEDDVAPAVLIIGVNVRRPIDEDYLEWLQHLRQAFTIHLDSVLVFEAETARRVQRDKLEAARTSLIQGAANAFRTPLTLISAPIDEVIQTTLSPTQTSRLKLAQRHVRRLEQLVDSLLQFTRLESGQLEPRYVSGDLAAFIRDITEIFRPVLHSRALDLRVKIDESVPKVVFDPGLFETVISNFMSHALQSTTTGPVKVELSYEEEGRWAVLLISYAGTPMPRAYLEVLSRGFQAVDTTGAGTELGLALAREIVRLHGGDLTIESVYPRRRMVVRSDGSEPTFTKLTTSEFPGSTFTVRFPTFHEHDGEGTVALGGYSDRLANDALQWSTGSADDDSVNGSLSGGWTDALLFERSDVLLVVDSDPEIRAYVRTLFMPFCHVLEAADGAQALELATTCKPGLILADRTIDKISGPDLLLAVRGDGRTRLTPFVFLATTSEEEDQATALVAGADDYILKPFKPRELLARVHLHMQMGKKRAELEFRFLQREKEFRILADYCPSGILRLANYSEMLYCNDAYLAPAGLTHSDLRNHSESWLDRIDPQDRENAERQWKQIAEGNEPTTNITYRWATGRCMSAVVVRLDLVDPGLTGMLACFSDVTDQEERLHEAERRRIEAEESKRQQELLVDLTSHEIRTPVSAILQCSSLVKENLATLRDKLERAGPEGFIPSPTLLSELEQDLEALESIYQCGLVQERIAGDVLSLARIQLDMLSVHEVDVDVAKQAQRLLSVFASEAKMNRISLSLDFGDMFRTMGVRAVKTDPVRFGQVVTNLVTNAMRFTSRAAVRNITVRYDLAWDPPAGGSCAVPTSPSATAPLHTAVPPDNTPVYLYVSVTDTGPGMTPDEQKLLFQRFQQGNNRIHTQYGGSGLGLFICRKLTQLLGGDIQVESKVARGTTFRFYIKTHTANMLPLLPQSPLLTPIKERDMPHLALLPRRILVVEDNIINQTVLKRQMIKAGLECDVASNGQKALDLIEAAEDAATPYDVILMDVEMPVMDGITAVTRLRALETATSVPRRLVIALTGNARGGQIDQARAAGFDRVVIKPYRLPALLETIQDAMAKHKASGSSPTS